jgi:hypothetical protein
MSAAAIIAVTAALALVYVAATSVRLVVLALRTGGRRDDAMSDREALAESRFTIPVSLIVPVVDALMSSADPDDTVADLLALHYPEFELIVVVDEGHPRATALQSSWRLAPCEFYYRQALPTAGVRRIFRSARDGRLIVVEKEAGGLADALNCGVNLARFRYAALVQPGVRCDRDALMRAMTAPIRDPAGIVAATSHVAVESRWFDALDTARAVLDSRIGWSGPEGIGPESRVAVWRRDVILQMEGFSTRAADPGMDLMARLHSRPREEGAAATLVVRTPAVFGTSSISPGRIATRAAALQAACALARTPRTAAFRALIASSLLRPASEFWAVAGMTLAAASGGVSWWQPALAVVVVSFCRALVSTAALLVRGSFMNAPRSHVLNALIALSPAEVAVRGVVDAAAWIGAVGVLVRPRH